MTQQDPDRAARRASERGLLGGLLRGGDPAPALALPEAALGDHAHRLLFRLCLRLHAAGAKIDMPALALALLDAGSLAELGPDPYAYVAELWERGHAGGLAFHAEALRRCLARDEAARAASSLALAAGSPGFDAAEVLRQAEAALTPLRKLAEPAPDARREGRAVATVADLRRAGAEVSWLWRPWIQRGTLTAVAAEGGTGKTRFCADLLRRVRHGLPWPDAQPMDLPPDSRALWVCADNHHDEMVTLARDFGVEDVLSFNAWSDEPYGGVALETAEDLADLDARIGMVKPVLVVIDTVGNATQKNLSRQEDAAAFYAPLQVLARRHRCAILALTHLNAGGTFLGRRVLEKVRVAVRMARPDPNDKRRALEVVKSNSKRPEPLGVTMGDGGNDYDAAPPVTPLDEPGAAPAAGKAKAADWLRQRLEEGPAAVTALRDDAEDAGVSTPALYRAKDRLHVEEYLDGNRKWWRLPEDDAPVFPIDVIPLHERNGFHPP